VFIARRPHADLSLSTDSRPIKTIKPVSGGTSRWLERGYGLNANESAMLLGFAMKYAVVDLVGTQASIAAKLPKVTLASFAKK